MVLWSPNNQTYKALFTKEQEAGLNEVIEKGEVPPQYDLVITTGIVGRSINVYDAAIQDWICNSNEYEEIGQFIRARFPPERKYLLDSAKGLLEFVRNGFPIDYYEWHNLDELRALIKEKPIYSKAENGEAVCQLTTFNAVVKEYEELVEKRRYGKKHLIQYRIKQH